MSKDKSVRISEESYVKLRDIQLEISKDEDAVISIKRALGKVIDEKWEGE